MEISVDTNGAKGPNIAGRDLFYFALMADGSVIPDVTVSVFLSGGYKDPAQLQEMGKYCESRGSGCYALILLNNWKMKY